MFVEQRHVVAPRSIAWLSHADFRNSIDDDRRKDHEHCRCCHYVHRRHQHLHPADLPSYYEILELPCGCRDRRGCLEQRLRKANFNGTCPVCLRFKLFKKWTLDGWFELRVETVDINYLLKKKWDPDCSICLRPYAKAIDPKKSRKASSSSFIIREKPIQLPCKHILGYRCMKKWLGPKSEGGSQNNTCPMCRKVSLFFKHLSQILQRVWETGDSSNCYRLLVSILMHFQTLTSNSDSGFDVGVLHCVDEPGRGRL